MVDRDENIALVKTALLGRWEVARIGKDGLISKHIREYPIQGLEEIFIDFAEYKFKELGGDGFILKLKEKGIKITVEPLENEN
jgi:hypothetical protein